MRDLGNGGIHCGHPGVASHAWNPEGLAQCPVHLQGAVEGGEVPRRKGKSGGGGLTQGRGGGGWG